MKKIILIGCTSNLRAVIKSLSKLNNQKLKIVGIINLNEKLGKKKSNFDNVLDLIKKFKFDSIQISKSINEKKTIKWIKNKNPHIIIQTGWSQKFGNELLKIPKDACIGIHPSPLPIGRGAATLNWAIIKGYKNWGVSFFIMNNNYDGGPIIAKEEFKIDKYDYIGDILNKFDKITFGIIKKNINKWLKNQFIYKKNNKSNFFFKRRNPEDGEFNLKMTSNKIYKLVRALSDPYPGAFFMYNQKKIIVLKANLIKKVNNNFFEKKKYFKMNKAIVFKVKKSFISFEKIKINNNKIVNGNKLNDFIK